MNQKEISELRRRFQPEKSAISRVYGCYVNTNREIISDLDESLGQMPVEEAEKYLSLLKKTLSGTLGRNLIDIVFSSQQVMDSEEHRLLSALRSTGLKDRALRQEFYEKVIEALDMGESNYLLLLAHDEYDVPRRGKSVDSGSDLDSDSVFSYILCCVCPVKDGKMELGYFAGENEFHGCSASQIVSPPETGFLFPAFDDRAANIYNALFYTKDAGRLHQEFIDAVFRTEAPMSAAEQRETFEAVLQETLEDGCSMEVVQSVHERLREKIQRHKEEKDPEPLEVTSREIGTILESCGVPQEKAEAFQKGCEERFGGGALNPANLIDAGRFEIKTPEATVSVDPEQSYLVETRVIDGRRYLLIPVEKGVEINGLPVEIVSAPSEEETAE